MFRCVLSVAFLAAITLACSHQMSTQPSPMSTPAKTLASSGSATTQSSPNGVSGSMTAFYDGEMFMINFKEQPSNAESTLIARNGSTNTIYMSDRCAPGGQDFMAVLDAIQGDGFNPLWQEVQVNFTNPANCTQYTSDNAILAAKSAGIVTLQPTGELYRCSVIGPKWDLRGPSDDRRT